MTKTNQKIPEGWSVKKLIDVCPLQRGFDLPEQDIVAGDYPIVYSNGVKGTHNTYKAKAPGVVTGRSGTIGKVTYVTKDYWPHNTSLWVTDFKGNSPKFIFYKIQNLKFSKFDSGSGVPTLNRNDVHIERILLPPLCEQEKIAEILGTWDTAIEKLTALIAAKRLQKKGLVYSYVKNAKDTDLYTISDLFSLTRGRIISKNEIEQNLGIYPVFSSQTSNDGILGYIDSFDYDGEFITWTTDGANAGRVFFRKGRFNCTNVCGLASLKNGISLNLYYTMTYLNLVTKYYVSYVGNPKLMNNAFASISLHLPNIDYQNKVADILSKADEEIDLLTRKLSALKTQKTGLMQKLLTGQIRVKAT